MEHSILTDKGLLEILLDTRRPPALTSGRL